MSLKEALDAAHGHEHAEDGSELTGKPSEMPSETAQKGEQSPFWMIVSGCLFALLVLVAVRKKGRRAE